MVSWGDLDGSAPCVCDETESATQLYVPCIMAIMLMQWVIAKGGKFYEQEVLVYNQGYARVPARVTHTILMHIASVSPRTCSTASTTSLT